MSEANTNSTGSFTCEECRELLSGYVDRELSETERAGVEAHLKTCEKCARESTNLKGLKNVVSHWDGVTASPGFRQKVVQEFIRESQMLPSKPFTEAAERAREQSGRTEAQHAAPKNPIKLMLVLAVVGIVIWWCYVLFKGGK